MPRTRLPRIAVLAACLALSGIVDAAAQSTAIEASPSIVYAGQAHYGAPLRTAVGIALLIPTGGWTCDGWCSSRGVALQAAAGRGGWRLGAGVSTLGLLPADAMVTVTRTLSMPRGASPESTYIGVEGGFAFPFFEVGDAVLLSVRPSVGYARRVQGGPTRTNRTTRTWSIGVTLMVPKFRDAGGG